MEGPLLSFIHPRTHPQDLLKRVVQRPRCRLIEIGSVYEEA